MDAVRDAELQGAVHRHTRLTGSLAVLGHYFLERAGCGGTSLGRTTGQWEWDGSARRGEFLQVPGLRFSFDPDRPSGEKVLNHAIIDGGGAVADALVRNGQVVGDPVRSIRLVSIDFIANGAEGFPRVGTNVMPLMEGAGRLTDQLALKSCLQARLPIGGDATYDQADDNNYTSDNRIQNLRFRPDQVF